MHACVFRASCVASVSVRVDNVNGRRVVRLSDRRKHSGSASTSCKLPAAAAASARGVQCSAAPSDASEPPRRWSRDDSTDINDSNAVKQVTRKRGDCYGCGVALQTDTPEVSGYVPLIDYETKETHRQLNGMLLCSRCSDLSHGRMVNAVAGQGGARETSGLITPIQLRESLMHIKDKKALVVKVVDATDFHGSFLNKVRDVVGSNPILLVLTKVDLLPKTVDLEDLEDWVYEEVVVKRRLTLASVVCVSSRKNTNMKKAVGTMFAERKGRDVYVLGSANVGKSTFIRSALKAMREEGNYGVPGKRLPTASAMPGTTLGVIPLRAFENKGTMYDTPGVFLHHRLNSILSGDEIKRFGLGNSLKKFQARPRVGDETEDREQGFKGLSLLWGPLLRIDVLENTTSNAGLVFFGPKGMRVTVVETSSLPSLDSMEQKAVAEKEERKAANVSSGAEELASAFQSELFDESENSDVNVAPSAAFAAAQGSALTLQLEDEMLQVPTSDEGDDSHSDSELGSSENPEFIQRLVKETRIVSDEKTDERLDGRPGAVRDLSVSGMNGWLRVTKETRDGPCEMHVRVLGPRGLEVFDREPMPVT